MSRRLFNLPNLAFALRTPKAIHLILGEHGEIWGILGVGWRAGEQKRQYL